jgi:hypothetical protein
MKIVFESSNMMPSISKAISILTNGARISLDNIHYVASDGEVEILMQRKELTGFKKSFMGVTEPIYTQTLIDTVLTIREVVEMNIKVDERLVTECNSRFTLLFGLNINNNELYLGSVEEAQGKILCEVFIKVKGISIECVDRVKK